MTSCTRPSEHSDTGRPPRSTPTAQTAGAGAISCAVRSDPPVMQRSAPALRASEHDARAVTAVAACRDPYRVYCVRVSSPLWLLAGDGGPLTAGEVTDMLIGRSAVAARQTEIRSGSKRRRGVKKDRGRVRWVTMCRCRLGRSSRRSQARLLTCLPEEPERVCGDVADYRGTPPEHDPQAASERLERVGARRRPFCGRGL